MHSVWVGYQQFLMLCLGMLTGAMVGFAATRLVYQARLRAILHRLTLLDTGRKQTQDLLMQARQQTEALQKKLSTSRQTHAAPAAPAPMPVPAAKPVQSVPVINLPDDMPDNLPARGFADTMPMSASQY